MIIGKENICFFIVPPSGGTSVFKYVEKADDPGLRRGRLCQQR